MVVLFLLGEFLEAEVFFTSPGCYWNGAEISHWGSLQKSFRMQVGPMEWPYHLSDPSGMSDVAYQPALLRCIQSLHTESSPLQGGLKAILCKAPKHLSNSCRPTWASLWKPVFICDVRVFFLILYHQNNSKLLITIYHQTAAIAALGLQSIILFFFFSFLRALLLFLLLLLWAIITMLTVVLRRG